MITLTVLLEGTLGLDIVNDHMIELANYLDTFTSNHLSAFQAVAQGIGTIFALIVVAIQAYKVMAMQQGRFDILAIARPLLFAFIIAWWPAVFNTVTAPGKQIESYFQGKYELVKVEVESKRQARLEASKQLTDKLREKRAAAEEAERAASGGEDKSLLTQVSDFVSDGWDSIMDNVKGWILTVQSYFANWFEGFVVWLGELWWQVSVYFIFLLKAIYLAALAMFGPVYMACSILPAWKDTWAQWIGKAVSVSLYGAMAYLVMIFSMQLMKFGIEADTTVISNIVAGDESIGNYMVSAFGTTIQTVIGMICGAMAMKVVPEIASWAVPSQAIMAGNSFMQGTAGKVNSKTSGGIMG